MPPDDPQALLDIALQCSHLAELVGEYSLDELAAA
jgi:hypothetical protein